MRICYVCKAVDEGNATVATQVRWIRALAGHPRVDHVLVLTRHHGRADLPDNVTVRAFGAEGWPRTVAGFLREALRLRRRQVDCFLVAQGGPYPALLLPFKVALRRPVYQWKAHPHVSPRMRFYARWCDDLVFTPTRGSFPLGLDTVRVVGHGIDTELFTFAADQPRSAGVAAIGRIAAVKRLDLAVEAVARCRDRWGVVPHLDVVGPVAPKDEAYRRQLGELVSRLGLDGDVSFHGPVDHDRLPELLGRYRATLNLSRTAFDKAAGESMAVGTPVITTNDCTAEMLPDDLRRLLAVGDGVDSLAEALREVTSWDDATREQVGRQLRATVVAGHDLASLFDKILGEIDAHLAGRRPHRASAASGSVGVRAGEVDGPARSAQH